MYNLHYINIYIYKFGSFYFTSIYVSTYTFIGDPNLTLDVKETWNWNNLGYYELELNVTLPNVSYVREGMRFLEIGVHTLKKKAAEGVILIDQILPSERIFANVSLLFDQYENLIL